MQLSKFSDYSFRALIYLAQHNETLNTIENMAAELKISQNHLKKIIHKLSRGNFIQTFRGRDGGIKLAKNPEDIELSEVLIYTESNTDFVECLKHSSDYTKCPYQINCNLKTIINKAKESFIREFKEHSLQDLLQNIDTMYQQYKS